MKYESQSWFLRGGYHFSEQHYIGGIFEFTQQKFDIRDMTFPAYLRPTEDKDLQSRPFIQSKIMVHINILVMAEALNMQVGFISMNTIENSV